MEIIKSAIKEVSLVLGQQNYDESVSYRLSYYVISVKVTNGYVLYNSLLGSIVLCPKIAINRLLIAYWYFVPQQYNERLLVKKVRDCLRTKFKFTGLRTFTIYPTTDCNAKCYYCFENGRKKESMSIDTATLCSNYIIEKSKPGKISIRWFGGEPLLNTIAINTICDSLVRSNINFESKMASNGFLFNQNLIQTAKKHWKLTHVQITLDGTEENYIRIKKYKTDLNAFQKVIHNIQILTEQSIIVVIRLNVDSANIDNQIALLKNTLIPTFDCNKNIEIYSHLLMDAIKDDDKRNRAKLFKKKHYMDRLITKHNLSVHTDVPNSFVLYKCIADNRESVTILPNGQIGLCEHYTEDRFISDLLHPEIQDIKQISEIRTYAEDLDLCKDCPYYPRCLRLIYCPNSDVCNVEIKRQKIHYMKDEVMSEYLRWVSKK